MTKLDRRLHPFRPDLAAEHLKERVEAARFTAGERRQVAHGIADLRRQPAEDAELDSQLLGGEIVTLYDQVDGWAWIQNLTDGYVGYVPAEALSAEVRQPSHAVSVLRSFVYADADMKAPMQDSLSMGAALTVIREGEEFSELAGGGWVYRRHLAPLDAVAPDYVATALQFLGVPYLWGGRSSLGLDCSALVQIALNRAGLPCPRDSDMQAESLGHARPLGVARERGDLIYLPDHVAIALDDWRVVHANALDMQVVIEPLADLVARTEAESGRGIIAVRRPLQSA